MNNLTRAILATAAVIATLTACNSSDGPDPEPPTVDPPTETEYFALNHAYGSYYHTYWGDKAGDYYLILTDKDLDKDDGKPSKHRIDIDFLSLLSTDPHNARPKDGTYTIGTSESNKEGIFIEGFLDAGPQGISPYGTYWNEMQQDGSTTVHAIVGGTLTIATQGNVTTVRAQFIDENDSTLRVSYQGPLIFENRVNEEYKGDSRLYEDYTMNPDSPVVQIKRFASESTAQYDRWDLYFYEKNSYATQGGEGYYIWFSLVTAPGQSFIPSGTYQATTLGSKPGFLPGSKQASGSSDGENKAVYTWLYGGRTPHAPLSNGSLTLKTTDGANYEVSFSLYDDHPIPYQVSGAFTGAVKKL